MGLSMKLTVCVCLLFIIAIEAAPKPNWHLPTYLPRLPPRYPTYQPPFYPTLPPLYPPWRVDPFGNQGTNSMNKNSWDYCRCVIWETVHPRRGADYLNEIIDI